MLPHHAVLIGDNNTGKTTILESLDLALGPDRPNRTPPIDEHDFYQGRYLAKATPDTLTEGEDAAPDEIEVEPVEGEPEDAADDEAPRIEIEVTVTDLSEEQKARFGDYLEFWDSTTDAFYDQPDPAGVDSTHVAEALRVTFHGCYDPMKMTSRGEHTFLEAFPKAVLPYPSARKTSRYAASYICGHSGQVHGH